jgi:hypothetical protein
MKAISISQLLNNEEEEGEQNSPLPKYFQDSQDPLEKYAIN